MTTLLSKNIAAADPMVITIDDDDDTSDNIIIIDSISRSNNVNVKNIANCDTVQEESDFLFIIDKLPTPAKENLSKKRSASNDSDVSNHKESKRLKLSDGVSTEPALNYIPLGPVSTARRVKKKPSRLKKTYIFLDGICDYYMEKHGAYSKRKNDQLKRLKTRGETMITALELVKRCNQTLEQQMREWNLEEIKTDNVFEKFIINCQIVCAAEKTLDIEMKEGLVISIAYNRPCLKLKTAANKIITNMKNIVSKYDSVIIAEDKLTYFRAVAEWALENASNLKARGWHVKEMTDVIRDGFFQDGKPIFLSPCCSTKAVEGQKILAKANRASSQVHSELTNFSKLSLVNSTRIVSAAAGSATSPVRNDIEITDIILGSTPSKTLNNTGCVTKLLENPYLETAKVIIPGPTSALNKENKSGRGREIKSVNLLPTICKSVINKTIVNNVQNGQPNLGFSERNRNSVVARTASNSNNNLVLRKDPRENQNIFLVSQVERASDLVPVFSNNNLNGGPQFFTTMKPQSQAIVQMSDNGDVNSLYTLSNGNQNFPRSNNLITSANFSPNNNINQLYGQFQNSLTNSNMVPFLNIPLQPTQLRPIAIDGSNVAFGHGVVNHKFSCKGIELCIKHFLQLGHTTVKAFVPHFRTRHSNQIVDREILSQRGMKQYVVFTPSRQIDGQMIVCYDDRFILDYAVDSGAVVVSNDNFRDLQFESPQYNFIIKNRLLMYTFVEDLFLIPKDPLGRRGPDLKTFLRF